MSKADDECSYMDEVAQLAVCWNVSFIIHTLFDLIRERI